MRVLEYDFMQQDLEPGKCCAEFILAEEKARISRMSELLLALRECLICEESAGGERRFDGGEEGPLQETDDNDEVGVLIIE